MVMNCDKWKSGELWHGEVSINVMSEFITLMLSYVFALPSIIDQ